VVGDSVMALWANPVENLHQRQQAVNAALDILDRVSEFNHLHPGHELPTRIGLHYGAMMIGHVGAVDHYEYRAVGDIVNTGSRIEGMSKHLGVHLLASAAVIDGLTGFNSRYVGQFTLKGKTVALSLYEVVSKEMFASGAKKQLWESFDAALHLFQQGQWADAGAAFSRILVSYPEDGPTRFYQHYCENYKFIAPENWRGLINMQDK
jgi:adenylate cyclase